ncbi:hypothetical protein [Sphingomonas mesophila]|uniref:hypothetical protein n=1 Tax=Sphingomonas mesophila TaxID=2303576 RepID=UPI000E57A03E|nr:hypothetical protein [Sphingomonas mesophila]
MKFRDLALGAALLVTPLAAASAMPVATFLAKADALEKKGAMAVFSKDLKLLMNQVKKDAGELSAANKAAAAAGKPKAYCTPGGVKLSNRDVLAAMRAVPVAQRATTSSKDALKAHLARRYPC